MYSGEPQTRLDPVIPASDSTRAIPKSVSFTVCASQQDVLGLDVAVDDAARVRVGQRLGDRQRDPPRLIVRERAVAIEAAAQILAADQLHDQIGPPVGLARLAHRHDAGVIEEAHHLRLAQKSPAGGAIGGELRKSCLSATS